MLGLKEKERESPRGLSSEIKRLKLVTDTIKYSMGQGGVRKHEVVG